MLRTIIFLVFAFCCVAFSTAQSCRPLVMIHGENETASDMGNFGRFARKAFPGLLAISLDYYYGEEGESTPLETQLNLFSERLQHILNQWGEVTLLGYSRGAVIARALVERLNDKRIHTFISLAGPVAGVYDPASPLRSSDCRKNETASCDMYKNPGNLKNYFASNPFLPYLDNQIRTNESSLNKEAFEKLSKLVLVGGQDDEVIKPWQSAFFGFYNDQMQVQSFEDLQFYQENWFGLRTLVEQNRTVQCQKDGFTHSDFLRSQEIFDDCVRQFVCDDLPPTTSTVATTTTTSTKTITPGPAYRPFVIIPGENVTEPEMGNFGKFARKAFPGILAVNLYYYGGEEGNIPIDDQLDLYAERLGHLLYKWGDITLVGFSRGAVIARALIERLSDPRIHTFISMAGPLAGTFDPSAPLKSECEDKETAECDMYKVAADVKEYIATNQFMPYLDNQIRTNFSSDNKAAFTKLTKLVLVGGEDDEVIKPWQSSFFGFYDDKMQMQSYDKLQSYQEDWFGLRTLDEADKVVTCSQSGVSHFEFIKSQAVFDECVKPYVA